VLGPFEFSDDDVQRALGGGRARSLLALLVLHRNEVLPDDRIVEALWAGDPPADARMLVEDDVARLTELLGAEVVVSHPWGRGVRLPVGSVDADDFLRLVDRARSEDPGAAVGTLREALAIWRGPALADFTDRSFAREEIARLERAQRAAAAAVLDFAEPGESGRREESESRKRRLLAAAARRWKVVAAAAVVIAVAAVAVVLGARRGEPRPVATGPNMVAALDPKSNRVVDAFTVGSVPTNVEVGGNAVWDYNANDKTVSLIDPRTRLVRTVATGGDVSSFGVAPGSAWVGNGWSGTVSRIDPQSAEVVRTIRLPGERWTAAGFIATSPTEIWVSGVTLPSNAPSPLEPLPDPPPPPSAIHVHLRAWRIDPRTNRIVRTISLAHVGNFSRAFLISGDSVLVRGDYGLTRIDRRTGRVERRLALPSQGCCESAGLAVGEGSIWVVGVARSVLWRIDQRGGRVVIEATIPLPGQPAGLAVGAGAVWIADATGGILRIDPTKNEVVKRIPITGVPHSLAFGLSRLWITLD